MIAQGDHAPATTDDVSRVASSLVDSLSSCDSPAAAARETLHAVAGRLEGRRGWLRHHGELVTRSDTAQGPPPADGVRWQLHQDWELVITPAPEDPESLAADEAELAAARTAMRLLERQVELQADAVRAARGQRQFEILLEVQRLIGRREPRQLILDALVHGAMELLGAQTASIHERIQGDPHHLTMVSWVGLIGEFAEQFERSHVDDGLSGQVVREDRTVVTHTYAEVPGARATLAQSGITGVLGAPIHDDDEPVAALVVSTRDPLHRFTDEDEETLAAFTAHAELAIRDARVLAERDAALHDALTGLPGRRLLLDRLEHALDRRGREDLDVSVLFLDLDRFKPINDSLGHAAGDLVLSEMATRIQRSLRRPDTAARIGGDEFAVVLEGADTAVADRIAHRLVELVNEPFAVAGREVTLGVSIGIASAAAVAGDAEDLLQAADLAMYTAKERAGAAIAHHDEAMLQAVSERLELDEDVRHVLGTDQLRLVFQPIVRLTDPGALAVEALLRWRHPTRGDVPPLDLVRRAEVTGEIGRIGEWVLREACAQVASWQDALGDRRVVVSVNVSVRQLEDPRFSDLVKDVLLTTGVAPDSLRLEVTESAVAAFPAQVAQQLELLRQIGVGIALDDFGSGHSSLGALRNLPVDVLKLDRSLLPADDGDDDEWALIEATAHLAAQLGLELVVEGVETRQQLQRVRDLRCPVVQGFHLARPLEAAAATEWLRTEAGKRQD